MALCASRNLPPSEKLSGVTLRTPMIRVRSPSTSLRDGRCNVNFLRRVMAPIRTQSSPRAEIRGEEDVADNSATVGKLFRSKLLRIGGRVVGSAMDNAHAAAPGDFHAERMPAGFLTRGRIEAERVLGAEVLDDIAIGVGDGARFVQKI